MVRLVVNKVCAVGQLQVEAGGGGDVEAHPDRQQVVVRRRDHNLAECGLRQVDADEIAVKVDRLQRFGMADEYADAYAIHLLDVHGVGEKVLTLQQFSIDLDVNRAEASDAEEDIQDCGLCLLAGEDHRRSCFRVNRILVVDLYRFLSQKRIGGDGRGFPAAPHNHTGVQQRKQPHARRIFRALDGLVPSRLAQVEQLIEVLDAGAIVREGDEGG